jgi:hypothetical protein
VPLRASAARALPAFSTAEEKRARTNFGPVAEVEIAWRRFAATEAPRHDVLVCEIKTGGRRMSITFHCPNGHLLKVKDKYAGQTGLCPKCQARVLVPKLPEPMSDDAIADFIGPPPVNDDRPVHQEMPSGDPAGMSGSSLIQSSMAARETKICPKCKREVRVCYTLCPHCQTYFSDVTEISRRLTR